MEIMKMKAYACATLLAATFSGCATMSVEECRHASWEALGRADGANGKKPDYLFTRSKNCIKHGIKPNHTLWEKGRQKGLYDYCTPTNLYNQGLQGSGFSAVCGFLSTKQQNLLDKRYHEGKKIYQLRDGIASVKSKISQHEKEFNKLRDGDTTGYKTQREASDRMIELDRKIQQLRKELWQKEKQLGLLD